MLGDLYSVTKRKSPLDLFVLHGAGRGLSSTCLLLGLKQKE